MKAYQKIMMLAGLLLALLTTVSTQAQDRGRGHRNSGGLSDEMMKELGLSDEQKKEIALIKNAYKSKTKAIRQANKGDREKQRTAMKVLRRDRRLDIEKVLTEEQLSLLNEKKANKREARREKWADVDKEALRTELKTYREKNMEPTLRAQRAKLEPQISEADRATLRELRLTMAERKAAVQAEMKKRKATGEKRSREDRAARRTQRQNDPNRKALKALVDKYEESIEKLIVEIESQRSQWRADQRAIVEKYIPDGEAGKGQKRGKKDREEIGQRIGKAAFLLMEG